MTWKDRTVIKKGEAVIIFKDNPRGEFAADDFAEQAGRVGHRQSSKSGH